MEVKFFVTTTIKPEHQQVQRAKELAMLLNVPDIHRGNQSLSKLQQDVNIDTCLVVGKHKLIAYHESNQYYFHPNMAKLRLLRLKRKQHDHFVDACGLGSGIRFLDCTLGMGADSIVAAHVIGAEGKVIGLESNPLISLLVKYGLKNYEDENSELIKAMQRVEVINSTYETFLTEQPDKSFDIVYFDPMFGNSIPESVGLQLIHLLGNKEPLNVNIMREARRVAKKRVVIKERSHSQVFTSCSVDKIVGGKHSPVAYGVIEI